MFSGQSERCQPGPTRFTFFKEPIAGSASTTSTSGPRFRSGDHQDLHLLPGAPRGAIRPGGDERAPPCGLSQQAVEAEGSLTLEAQVRVGAALTTPGRFGTARRAGSGKQDGRCTNAETSGGTPSRGCAGSNLVDRGRIAVGACRETRRATPGRDREARPGGHGESLRRSRGEAAGEELGTYPVDRLMVNVGTVARSPYLTASQAGSGKACRLLMAWWRGGESVVVRGRESRPHGEGTQRVRRVGLACQEDAGEHRRTVAEPHRGGAAGTGDPDQAAPMGHR